MTNDEFLEEHKFDFENACPRCGYPQTLPDVWCLEHWEKEETKE